MDSQIDNQDTDEKVNIVVRQTNYDNELALKKLIEFNYNIESVIKDYMGIKPKIKKEYTINQQIYKEIRNMMDTASFEYEKKKQMEINK
tara:strand:+ start:8684 stop:8950 length:267 start_codon:yes stop_codon:yes gene_type:complete